MGLNYFIGKGDILLANRDANGNPLAFRNVGEANIFELAPTVTYVDNYATDKTGPNQQDAHIAIRRELKVMIGFKEVFGPQAKNLELLLHADTNTEIAGTVATSPLPPALLVGDIVQLPGAHAAVTPGSVVIKTAAAIALVEGADYSIDYDFGTLTLLTTQASQPLTAAYGYGAPKTDVRIFSSTPAELALLFEGINLAVGAGQKNLVQLHRVSFDPTTKFSLKGDVIEEFSINAIALLDPNKSSSAALGRFGRFRVIA